MRNWLTFASLICSLAVSSQAAVLTFEGVAPPGGVVNVSPTTPYHEAGFTLTPSDANSAVFAADAPFMFPGDNTAWFGFAGADTTGTIITLTGPVPFDLDSALLGPSTIGTGRVNLTVVGNVVGGGTKTVTFTGLTTATLETINFTNLQSATFTATSDAAMDNVSLNVIPEPGGVFLFGGGLIAMIGLWRWRSRIVTE